jgi:hypothetical protein
LRIYPWGNVKPYNLQVGEFSNLILKTLQTELTRQRHGMAVNLYSFAYSLFPERLSGFSK